MINEPLLKDQQYPTCQEICQTNHNSRHIVNLKISNGSIYLSLSKCWQDKNIWDAYKDCSSLRSKLIIWFVFLCDILVCVLQMEINQAMGDDQSNQYDITMATHYDIIMGNDIQGMPIVKSQWVMMLLGTSIVMSQWVTTLLWTSFIVYSLLSA